jgi:aryl-alcohol dehydrogenase-like predicted oxidoreductase
MTSKTGKAPAGGARDFGKTGLVVSRLGYGAMELTGAPRARDLSEADAIKFINSVVDSGINYIDTSIDYGWSEMLIGKALQHRRSDFYLASKCGCQVGIEGPHEKGESHTFTPENITAGVEQSLRRLKTDYLDVVQVHGSPNRKELEELGAIDAIGELKRRGLIRHGGISTRMPLLEEFIDVDAFTVFQVPYSALQRANEDALAVLKRAGKSVVIRGITGRGAPAKNWTTRPIGTVGGEVREIWEKAKLDEIIGGMSRIEFMIRFALTNENVDVALVATTDPAHLASDIEIAAKGPLDKELYRKACERLAVAGSAPGKGKYAKGGPTPVL